MSKRKVVVYFKPVELEVEISDDLDKDEIEQELDKIVYYEKIDEIVNETVIDYFDEV